MTSVKLPSWAGPVAALALVLVAFAIAAPSTFLRTSNVVTMARQTAVVGIAACGMAIVIASGGIDLSVGSMVALSTVVIARALQLGVGPVPAALGAVCLAGAIGAGSGLLVARARIPAFIVTLGAMTILRGAAKGLANEQKIDAPSGSLERLVHGGGVGGAPPPSVWLLVVIVTAAAFALSRTRFGRRVIAVGSNESAAHLAGVPVARMQVLVYALCSALAGVAGVIEFATLTVGDPTDSIGLELDVIAAVVVGGGSLSGGRASVVGALVGAFLMTAIRTGSAHVGLPNWIQEITAGLIIVAAVAYDRRRS